MINDNISSGYMSSNSFINNKNLSLSKQALLFPPVNSSKLNNQQQSQQNSNHESPESGYSTPTNNFNKKLFYEVIV